MECSCGFVGVLAPGGGVFGEDEDEEVWSGVGGCAGVFDEAVEVSGFCFVEYGWWGGINARCERPIEAGIWAAVVYSLFRTKDRGECNVLVEEFAIQHHYDGQEGEDDAVPQVKKIASRHR